MAIRVLLIDDDVAYVEALSRALVRRGFAVRSAADGPTALALMRVETSDVIVLDFDLSRADGPETLAGLRAIDQGLPVLVLSGQGQLEQASEALRGGAVDFLLKPCSVETLADAIEDAHEWRLAARETARAVDKRLN